MAVRDVVQAAAGVGGGAGELANAIDFDRLNDYLSSSGDLTGATNSKTMTLSAWIYPTGTSEFYIHGYAYSTNVIRLQYNSNGFNLKLEKSDSAGTTILNAISASASIPKDTWSHLLISFDLNNSALRHVYLNDNPLSMTWYSYTNSQYVESAISNVRVGDNFEGSRSFGRMAHVFKDNTYRDLTVVANRRLFITADLKPADGQADLNPILYLPLGDPEDIGYNAGTGGNLNVNGVMARSQRGPNQDNCVASNLDGSNDYLSRTANLTGVSDSKTFTLAFNALVDIGASADNRVLNFGEGSSNRLLVQFGGSGSNRKIEIYGYNASGTTILAGSSASGTFVEGRNYNVVISVDMTDVAKRLVYVNGQPLSVTWTTYTNDTFDFSYSSANYRLGTNLSTGQWLNGALGEVYFHTTYTNLLTGNPFWDADANRPKPVRQVLEETGNTPLIAMPLVANNAGLNLGTGGNFTVNSGPYVGARGGSEYWARSANFDNSTSNYLAGSTNGTNSADTSYTLVCAFKTSLTTSNRTLISVGGFAPLISYNQLFAWIGTGSGYVQFTGPSIADNVWHTLLFSRSGGVYRVYVDGSAHSIDTGQSFNYISSTSDTSTTMLVGTQPGSANINGFIGGVYFVDSYIDFSQEANRLKFVDAFKYLTDLDAAIESGDVPTPLVYLKHNDPSALGTNSGTGSDFTVNGTVLPGPDVLPV